MVLLAGDEAPSILQRFPSSEWKDVAFPQGIELVLCGTVYGTANMRLISKSSDSEQGHHVTRAMCGMKLRFRSDCKTHNIYFKCFDVICCNYCTVVSMKVISFQNA